MTPPCYLHHVNKLALRTLSISLLKNVKQQLAVLLIHKLMDSEAIADYGYWQTLPLSFKGSQKRCQQLSAPRQLQQRLRSR